MLTMFNEVKKQNKEVAIASFNGQITTHAKEKAWDCVTTVTNMINRQK